MLKNALRALCALIAATGCSLLVGSLGIGNESIIMVFLLGVLFTAVLTSSRGWATGVAFLSVMLFNFLFTRPLYTFQVYNTSDIMLLMFFLVTAIVSGTVTSKLQKEMALAGQNEQTARTLYKISSAFLSANGRLGVVRLGEELVEEYTGCECAIALSPTGVTSATAAAYDINGASGNLGTLTFTDTLPDPGQELIVQSVCTELGIALEREKLVDEREHIKLAMERERQRSMLLRSVAHDLRSPLTALSGAGGLLADNYDELSDAERRKLSSDVSEEIVWLTDLVENILNMTRISEDQLLLRKQEEVVDDIVGEAVKHTERLLRNRQVTVSLPEEVVTAPMDGRLVTQVITNLLENAARHTPPEADIELSVKTVRGELLISVADKGQGVAPAIRDRLFESFVTQDERIVDGRRGLGLGLAICKSIVEAHGGKIWYAPNKPQGSVFSFTLPMEVEQ